MLYGTVTTLYNNHASALLISLLATWGQCMPYILAV